MAKELPRSPRLEHIKKEAKSLLKSLKTGSTENISVLRNLQQFAGLPDKELIKQRIKLHDVQFALALEYGFESWAKLENFIKHQAEFPDVSEPELSPVNPQIDWTPPGKPPWHPGWMNGYVRGLELILNREGIAVDYDTLMGDIGQAFIMQGEENSSCLIRGNVAMGWWPLESLGFMRLNFIEEVCGREIVDLLAPPSDVEKEPQKVYSQFYEPSILRSLEKGMPCIAVGIDDADCIITGCDKDRYPLIGACTNTPEGEVKIGRVTAPVPPHAMLLIGEDHNRISRAEADRKALEFAIALHGDQLLGPDQVSVERFHLRHVSTFNRTWRTGIRSFHAWIAELEKPDYSGEHHWSANVRNFLINNRKTATRYLEQMRSRHHEQVSAFLDKAIEKYKAVVALASSMDVSKDAIHTKPGRDHLINLIKDIIRTEREAISMLEKALDNMNPLK